MPASLSYPGVYIEEVPSSVKTITGTSTSITAFIGRCLKGPVNQPTTVTSFADYERIFGGLWLDNPLGYAIRDFYLNGGSQAIIVRAINDAITANLELDVSHGESTAKLKLKAANQGAWANNYKVSVTKVADNIAQTIAPTFGVAETDLFNLTITNSVTGETEQFNNLTLVPSVNQIDRVLQQSSMVAVVDGALPEGVLALVENVPFVGGADGEQLTGVEFVGSEAAKTGLNALYATHFNLLCLPGASDLDYDDCKAVITAAAKYCEDNKAFLIVDPPIAWKNIENAVTGMKTPISTSANAALFFPRVKLADPLRNNQLAEFNPCGMIAGSIARIDGQRGIWKAPAGIEAGLAGVSQLSVALTDADNGRVNSLGLNCLRNMPAAGPVIWGARTLQGNDQLASQWKYIPVRRMALYIETSLYNGLQWVVFEPNSESLWRQITLNVDSFMSNLFRQGAFKGTSKQDAYFVSCDSTTTTPYDIDTGVVNIAVGFAPLKPAEFVVLKLQQLTSQQQ